MGAFARPIEAFNNDKRAAYLPFWHRDESRDQKRLGVRKEGMTGMRRHVCSWGARQSPRPAFRSATSCSLESVLNAIIDYGELSITNRK